MFSLIKYKLKRDKEKFINKRTEKNLDPNH